MYLRSGILFSVVLLAVHLSGSFAAVMAQILPPGAVPTRVATGFNFTEGPVYDGQGSVYFTNLNFGNQNAGDIVRYDIAGGTTTVVDPNSGGANGLYLNANGQIVSADQGRHQLSLRSATDVSVVESVLADEWNSPNDLVIDAAGGIYFTDPDYNNVRAQSEGVYYRDPDGNVSRILQGFNRPNGIVLAPDGQTLYLAVEQEFRIMAYDVGPDGFPANEREFARTNVDAQGNPLPNIPFGPDGMSVDAIGNVYAAVHNAVFAWNPAGERLFSLAMPPMPFSPENPNNVLVGGAEGRTLYITAGRSLYSIELNLPLPETGDFNRDGIVNAADYVVWRNNNTGEFVPEDYDTWRENYGMEVAAAYASSAEVPEPAAWCLWLAGVGVSIRRRAA
jgi:gluconolactonase